MTKELKNRVLTSFFLIILLFLMFEYSYILISSLIIVSIISWIEFYGLIVRIFKKKSFNSIIIRFLFKALGLIYLVFFSYLVFNGISTIDFKLNMIYLLSVCVSSDIGGLLFGRIFKGKKLTKISPNKTIAGTVGSFFLSLMMVPYFYFFYLNSFNPYHLIIITIIVSLTCQLGDLFFSYLKRVAKVKDTGDLLPGHGGILDRIDGIIFAIPLGMVIWKFL